MRNMIRPSILSGTILVLSLGGSALASGRITGAGAIVLKQITLDQNLAGEVPNSSVAGAYPTAKFTWVLAYERNNGPDAETIKEMFNFMLSDEAQYVTPGLGFVPLRGDILAKSKTTLNKIGE